MTYESLSERVAKLCPPQRYILGIMGFLGVANAYIMRACLNIAITQMVKTPTVDNFTSNDPNSCPYEDSTKLNSAANSSSSIGKTTQGDFEWDEQTQGVILAAFYYGYIFTHIPGGLLAQRFGGKHTMGFGILSTAIFTLLTPTVAEWGAIPVSILRFLMGLGEGTTFPALSTLLSQWAPPLERSKLASLVFAGVQIGTVIASALSGLILEYFSWPSVFYVFGIVGVIWFVIWCLTCYNDPASHPYITDEERMYLATTIGATARDKELVGTPWKDILTSKAVWALTIAEIGHDFGLFMMVTDLPKYMSDVMHFKISENGLLSALPYLVMWIVSISLGYFADWLLAKRIMGITKLRVSLATLGAVGPAIGVILASYAGCNKAAVATLFTVGMGLMGFVYASLRVNSLDLSPNYSGTIMAIVNGLGSISGMVAPVLVGGLTPNRTLEEWRLVFWVMAVVLVTSNFFFVFWGSGEIQSWNEPPKNTNIQEEKNNKTNTNGTQPIKEVYRNYTNEIDMNTLSK